MSIDSISNELNFFLYDFNLYRAVWRFDLTEKEKRKLHRLSERLKKAERALYDYDTICYKEDVKQHPLLTEIAKTIALMTETLSDLNLNREANEKRDSLIEDGMNILSGMVFANHLCITD